MHEPPPPPPARPPRALISLIRAICERRGWALAALCDDWVLCVEHAGRTAHVVGYDFGLNTATARMLANDKAACAAVLGHAGLPHVEHALFVGPRRPAYAPPGGLWPAITAYWREHGCDVVCKPNTGTGGGGVTRVRRLPELEHAVHELLGHAPAVCLSPYLELEAEYRLIVLDRDVPIAFAKQRATVTGDGTRTVQQLILDHLHAASDRLARELLRGGLRAGELRRVPADGERVLLGWRHNLARGATAVPVSGDDPALAPLVPLALDAARTIGARFCSVDLALVAGRPRVLEINSGVMMEAFVTGVPDGRARAAAVYERALALALEA